MLVASVIGMFAAVYLQQASAASEKPVKPTNARRAFNPRFALKAVLSMTNE